MNNTYIKTKLFANEQIILDQIGNILSREIAMVLGESPTRTNSQIPPTIIYNFNKNKIYLSITRVIDIVYGKAVNRVELYRDCWLYPTPQNRYTAVFEDNTPPELIARKLVAFAISYEQFQYECKKQRIEERKKALEKDFI